MHGKRGGMVRSSLVAAIAMLAFGAAACGSGSGGAGAQNGGDKKVQAKFAYFVSADTSVGDGAKRFAELAAKYTNGSVEIKPYPNSQLGTVPTVLQAVQSNRIQFVATTNLSTIEPAADTILLPYLFPSTAVAQDVLNGPEVKSALWDKFKSHNVQVLGVWSQGFADLLTTHKVASPQDVAGMRIRIYDPNVGQPMYQALHANGVTIVPNQVFTALSTHVVDGVEDPPATLYGLKWYEEAKYLARTQHAYVSAPVLTSTKFLDSLSPSQRDGLLRAFKESIGYEVQRAAYYDKQATSEFQSSGVTMTQVDANAFKAATQPVYDSAKAKFGPVVDALTKAIAAHR